MSAERLRRVAGAIRREFDVDIEWEDPQLADVMLAVADLLDAASVIAGIEDRDLIGAGITTRHALAICDAWEAGR